MVLQRLMGPCSRCIPGPYCWDIAHADQPEPGARNPAGPPNGPDDEATPTGPPNGSHAGATDPGRPETEHVDATPRVQLDHGGTGTAPVLAHGRLKVSDQRDPGGCGEGRNVPPSTYGGRLKVSGRNDLVGRDEGRNVPPSTYGGEMKVSSRDRPAGRNSSASALWEQLQSHG